MDDQSEPAFSRRTLLALGGMSIGAGILAACAGPTVTQDSNASGAAGSLGGPGLESSSGGAGASISSTAANGTDYSGVKPAPNIEFWSDHPGANGPLETALVDAYNKSQSDTKVKLVTAGSNYAEVAQRFQTALASDHVPALVMVSDAWWFRYVLDGQTVPIEPLAEIAGLDTANYVETFYDDYSYQGQHWAVPYARSTPMFYYNKDHFKAAGLPDRAPKSWAEVDDFAKKLKAKDLGTQAVFNYATPENYLAWNFENNVWGAGGAYSKQWDLSPMMSDGTMAALKAAAATMQSNGGWAGMTSNNQTDDLSAETISMCTDSSGAIGHLTKNAKFTAGAGFMPAGPKENDHVCPTGGTGIALTVKSGPEQQLAGAKFLAYLTNPENAVKLGAATGYIPVRKSAKTDELVQKTPMIKVALDQLNHLRSEDWAQVGACGKAPAPCRNRSSNPASERNPVPKPLDAGPFFHGTIADVRVGEFLTAGRHSNYRPELVMNHVYFTARIDGAGLAAEIAVELARGRATPRVYEVVPTGEFEDDPNVTDKKFPGNPTRSYRSSAPLRVVGEIAEWTRLTPDQLQMWRERLSNLIASRAEIIN